MANITKFEGCNATFTNERTNTEIPAYYEQEGEKGEVITLYKLSFIERIIVLFFGEIWIKEETYRLPLAPKTVSTSKD